MDWKLLFSTFTLVFLAELGDKTQLATLSLAASGSSRMAVFLGSAAALILTSGIAVLLGGAVARVVPEVWIHRVAGVGFIIMGAIFLLGRGD
jgi:putative Ca2+/H+ antiporter (TMEM165/GDT1 family)